MSRTVISITAHPPVRRLLVCGYSRDPSCLCSDAPPLLRLITLMLRREARVVSPTEVKATG